VHKVQLGVWVQVEIQVVLVLKGLKVLLEPQVLKVIQER
jgi:hypothetical protein